MTIRLPEDVEVRLRHEASRRGVDTESYAVRLIDSQLPPAKSVKSLKELFLRWQKEDATDDPAELKRRQREFEKFKKAMNRNRRETDGRGARKVYP